MTYWLAASLAGVWMMIIGLLMLTDMRSPAGPCAHAMNYVSDNRDAYAVVGCD